MANPVLDPQYLARAFFDINERLDALETDSGSVATNVDTNAASIQAVVSGLVRFAIVITAIAASGGYPALGSGTIKLLSLEDPAVAETTILSCYNFKTSSFSANAIIPVVLMNGSYYVITT